ncbi:TPA: Abi family protein [Escherichia coli]
MNVYTKPFVSPSALIHTHLTPKGVTFSAPYGVVEAEEYLTRINWYRFKSYMHPFLVTGTKNYIPGTTFSQGVELYYFDCELRELCNKYILRIEVKAKTILDQVITSFTNDPFWYLNDDYFKKKDKLPSLRKKIADDLYYSKMEFAKYYKDNYISPKESWRTAPPFWLATELMSFDAFVKFAEALDSNKFMHSGTNKLGDAAKKMNAKNYLEMISWLLAIKELRNRASHNSRTWNSNYRLPSGFVSTNNVLVSGSYLAIPPSKTNKIYLILATIKLISDNLIKPQNNFYSELQALLNKYHNHSYILSGMGFPANWTSDPIW